MEPDNDKDANLKQLQAALFPPNPKSTGFFANFYIKSGTPFDVCSEEEEEEKRHEPPVKEPSPYLYNRENFIFLPQQPRWPTECQVLDGRVKHITYIPPVPEPYYICTGREVQLKPTGDEVGVIVFQYTPISAVNYFSRSSVGGSRYLLPANLCPEEDTLRFESRFESGNLARAIRITPNYYELYLRNDLYTNRHTQWFYFKITNTRKKFLYRLSIVNFSKEDSLYNEGMRPLMYSTKDAQLHSIGWKRCGENITYYSNDNVCPDDPDPQMTYTLTFTTDFPHDDDEVYIAHCYPYTYSDLEDYFLELSSHPVKSTYTSINLLCRSMAGNSVHYVTVTSQTIPEEVRDTREVRDTKESKKKRAVVITARVHPGETPSSWIMKGILDFLTSDCSVAKELRERFIFKLVPMLNPDGVIVGNNRCSLSAKDLNRQYRSVIRETYPSIWYTKLMVRRLMEECGVAMYCDLHAHSRKHNIFIYGCESRRGGEKKLQEQVFPLMLHKNTADKFSFESCKFRIQKAKEGTGRVVMWMMGIPNSYTMESSFAGSTMGTRCNTHFSVQDLEQMGKSFCQTLLDYSDGDPRKERLRVKIINRLVKGGSNADEPTNIQLSDYSSDEGDTSSSSSNEVGRDDEEIIQPLVPPPSPVVHRRNKPKTANTKRKSAQPQPSKSPNITRKPLPICKATLGLSLSAYSSDSSSDSDDVVRRKTVRRKQRKKKSAAKKKSSQILHYSDGEAGRDLRSVSVLDLTEPIEKVKTQVKRSKTPQPKTDRKNAITQQLSEVQAKLLILKNRLWFGSGGDAPLSWGTSGFANDYANRQKKKKKPPGTGPGDRAKKTSSTGQTLVSAAASAVPATSTKCKGDQKDAPPKKPHTGLRRQTAFEWGQKSDLKKAKSLPDNVTSTESKSTMKNLSCDEEQTKHRHHHHQEASKTKKRRPRSKFGRKQQQHQTKTASRVYSHTNNKD